MSYLETLAVTQAELDPRLLGRSLDQPRAGDRSDSVSLEVMGWVLGRESRAVAVEIVHAEQVVRRVPLRHHRPDLAPVFPDVADADQAGFRTTLEMVGMGEFELALQAVLADQQRVPLATLRVVHRWREDSYHAAAPLVSVVIPCYEQGRYLSEAIESVLAQTYPHLELVVVDDGSHDNTPEIALRYPGVRLVSQENAGLSGARNSGIRHSNGAYLIFLDADDRLLPNAVADGLAAFSDHPEAAFVAGRHRVIDEAGAVVEEKTPVDLEGDPYAALLRRNIIAMHATVMYQRIALQSVGGFDPTLGACEDYDLFLRLARRAPIFAQDRLIAEYRQHPSAMSRDVMRMRDAALAVLARQESYVSGNAALSSAYREGQAFWSTYYAPVDAAEPLRAPARSSASNGARAPRPSGRFGLVYHRIAERSMDPWALAVSPGNFAEQLEVLRSHWRPLSLDNFVAGLSDENQPDGAMVVTFDDGYADNLMIGLPILERHEIPATIFVASGYLDRASGFWWDDLQAMVFRSPQLPEDCQLDIAGRTFEYRVDRDGEPDGADDWRAWHEGMTGRRALYSALWAWLRPLLHAEREEALEAIAAWAGMPRAARQEDRAMTSAEVADLARHPLVTIGAHTVTHPWLAALTPAMQRLEIRGGGADLATTIGQPVDVFAYPFGGPADLGNDSMRLVAEAGYRAAFLGVLPSANAPTHPLLIPRRQVPDLNGEAFARWLVATDAQLQ